MRLTRLASDTIAARQAPAVALLEAIGAPDFAARLMQALAGVLPASHCTVFALRSNGRVQAISSASTVGDVAAITAVEYMRLGFDRQDSNMVWLARRKPARVRQFWVGHQFAEEVANEQYRRLCYGETGIRERLSLLAVFPDGFRVAVSLYRNHSYPDYTDRDRDCLAQQAALLGAAVMRHVQIAPHHRTGVPDHRQLLACLSAREREMISHVLAGRTTKEAAREMDVALNSALTYRYRAFQRLGIRSHRELLVLLGTTAGAS